MIAKEIYARIGAGLIAATVLLAMWPPLSGMLANGNGLLAAIWALLRMFTIITNLLVGLVFGWIAWKGTDRASPLIVGGTMLGVLLVGIVFNLLLGQLPHQTVWFAIGDCVHHAVAPMAVTLWWMVFMRHGALRWSAALVWMLYPVTYIVYSLIRAQFMLPGAGMRSRYPYFFMDADMLGWPMAIAWMAAIAVGFVLVGLVMISIDKLLAARTS
jgi:hypothetical protein